MNELNLEFIEIHSAEGSLQIWPPFPIHGDTE